MYERFSAARGAQQAQANGPDSVTPGRRCALSHSRLTALLALILFAPAAFGQSQPDAGDDGPYTVAEGGTLTPSPNVLANDTDDDFGDVLTVTAILTPPSYATGFSLTPGGLLSYTHNGSETTDDTIVYQVCDDELPVAQCDSATIDIEITPVNDAPTAVNDSASVVEDSANNAIDVLANDTDPEDDSLDVTAASASNGNVTIQGNNNLRYSPNADFSGQDAISYTISDGNGGTAGASVTVTVSPLPDAPVANNDAASVNEDSQNNSIDVTANDTDADGDPLTVTAASASNGSVSASNGNVIYTPNANFSGQDFINYTITDGTGRTDSAVVTVTVNSQNDPPTANDDSATVDEDSTNNVIAVTANDTDPDGDSLTVISAIASAGTATPSGGNVLFSPPADFGGQVTINYTISDGNGGTASAVVSVTVTSQNDAPVANNDVATVSEDSSNNPIDVLANDTDSDGDTLTVTAASAANGVATPGGGNLTYTPNPDFAGQDTISYSIADGNGGTGSGTVTVTVTNVNDLPVANDDTAEVDEDSTNNVINVVANDTDADGDTLTVTSAGASNGTASPSGGNVIYTPNAEFSGSDTINYTISDGNGGTASAVVTVTVNLVLDPPVAVNDGPVSVDEGGTTSGALNVLANDENPEETAMTAALVSGPANASDFVLNPDGSFRYTHDGSETTSDSFTYRPVNGSPEQAQPATVTLTINPVNDAPRFSGVVPPGLSTLEDTTLTIVIGDLRISDPDNAPGDFTLTLDPVVPPDANYALGGQSSVTPAENYNGQINVRATVSDGELSSAPFLIPVTVESVNDLPTVASVIGSQNAVEDSPFTLDISVNFADADGDQLSYTAVFDPELPAERGISFDGGTGQFSGAPDFNDDDPEDPVYTVTIRAEDPQGEFVTDVFDLTISQLGRANLGLSISVSPDTALPADELRWTFATDNPIGPSPGENVGLSGSFIGEGLAVGIESGANCTINTRTGRVDFDCIVGALPIGQTVPVVLSTTTSQVTEVVAFATSAGTLRVPIDPNPANNSAVRAIGVAARFSTGPVQFLGESAIRSVAASDVNGDGALDIVAGTVSGQPVQLYLGAAPRASCDCQRDFEVAPISIPDTGPNEGVAFADFDNNGTLDLVIANNGGQADTVYSNDGTGNFTPMAILEPSNGRDVAVGDFNNDGNIDIAIAAIGPNPLYLGDGAGGFGSPIMLGDSASNDVATGRFDDDQFADLVFANGGGASSQVYVGRASGVEPGEELAVGDTSAVAAGDLNNDGRDDIVFGREWANIDTIPSNPVFINQGDANFGAPLVELGISPTHDVHIGDVNDDGAPDLVFINTSGAHQVWTSTGGGFELYVEQIIDIDAVAGVLANLGFADTGDPGGLDLALGGAADAGVAVYLNDSEGNLGPGDPVPPVLTLLGQSVIDVPSGTAYNDPGAEATDNIDGDISSSIVIDNPVNTAVVGSYTVTYNVADFAGNAAAAVTRTVNVAPAAGQGGGGGGALSHWLLATLALLVVGSLAAARRKQRQRVVVTRKGR
jgi:hypothetical protein